MNAKIVYIAGKITGIEKESEVLFLNEQIRLLELGYEVYNPHVICSHFPIGTHWSEYMKYLMPYVMKADELSVLDNWRESKGAVYEICNAQMLHIPIRDAGTGKEFRYTIKPITL